jgi:hypothetical protein
MVALRIVKTQKRATEAAMTRPTLEIVSEDAGLYAVARDAGETIGVIGPMDDRDAIMAAAVERWPDVDHVDLPHQERGDA